MIAATSEWRLTDYRCTAGPDDAPFEEEHEGVTIAAVVDGQFRYRSDAGAVNLVPGAVLLGNARACYCCDHEHGVGDRCVVLSLRPDYFAEIAHAAAQDSGLRFARSMVPPGENLLRWVVALNLLADAHQPRLDEGRLSEFASWIAAHVGGTAPTRARASARERHRIRALCDLIANANDEAPDLSGLAAMAGLSKYHFLRIFRSETGVTPHQYRLQTRLHRAALRLVQTREPVAHIAFDSGFGDLSTFNARFRRCFGMTPTAFRNRS
jgi:AraC family transcriptional regulator